MSSYAGFQEKLKRRFEVVTLKADDLNEARKEFDIILEKLTSYLKGYAKENPVGVTHFEQIGGMAEGSSASVTPNFDVFMLIRPVQRCQLSDPEPPMGTVVPTAYVRRQSMETSPWRSFTEVVPPGNKHRILAEKIHPQLSELLEKALKYHTSIDGTFPKLSFRWQPPSDREKQLPLIKVLDVIDRPTGKVKLTISFFDCLEVDDDGVKSYALACGDDQWRLTFATRERDLLSSADKADSGCRLGCYTLVKALLNVQYPQLVRHRGAHQFAKAVLMREMHDTSNAASKWRQELYGDRFFAMLNHLTKGLKEGKLDHSYAKFMGGKANLLEGCTDLEAVLTDLEDRIKSPDSKLLPVLKQS